MRRFQKIDTEKELMDNIVQMLIQNNYSEVPNNTGGDEDFLMIDTMRKEFIWCECGFAPFCDDEMMRKYEFSSNQNDITLKELEDNGF